MAGERWLIVNADDLGLSTETSRGIFHAHEHGIVTSASLMVRPAAAAEAVEQSRAHPRLSIGLHVDLGDWCFENGDWRQISEVVPLDNLRKVKAAILQQLERFRQLTGRDPTHLDSHYTVHRTKPLRRIFTRVARELGVPLRLFNPTVTFCGEFYGQT